MTFAEHDTGPGPPDLTPGDPDTPSQPRARLTKGDRVFRVLATAATSVSLLIVVLALIFLVNGARPALEHAGIIKFFTTNVWDPSAGHFGVLGLLVGTVIIATIAMIISVPLAIGMAVFINEYAPYRVQRVLTSVVDLLAALPSLLFGIWGFFALEDRLVPAARWFSNHLSVIPIFKVPANTALVQSGFDAGAVVALMVLPIITSVSRDVMAQVPRDQCEGALALGGTRWGMIRDVVLPFGRSGIVGAALLGFGRARWARRSRSRSSLRSSSRPTSTSSSAGLAPSPRSSPRSSVRRARWSAAVSSLRVLPCSS